MQYNFRTPYNHIGLWFEVKECQQKTSHPLKIDDRSNISHPLKSRLLKILHPLIFPRTFSYPLIFPSKFSYPLKFAPTGYLWLKKTTPLLRLLNTEHQITVEHQHQQVSTHFHFCSHYEFVDLVGVLIFVFVVVGYL